MKKKIKLPELQVKVTRKNKEYDKFTIGNPDDVFNFAKMVFDSDTILWKEEFILLCVNTANDIIGTIRISSGGVAGTVVDPKWVFTSALGCCASGIILIHNHPSGNLKASSQDIELTKKIVTAGRALDIQVLDHIIIGGDFDGYISMNELNLM
jgi:DNA repair protein RadC